MKVVFFNRFFHPDTSATSQIVSDLAFHLASTGGNVHVVTSKVPGGEAAQEMVRGVTVHRVAAAIAGPHGLARRAVAYAAYYSGARRIARLLLEPGDVAVLKTDPPLLSAAVGPIARRRGAKVVAWMQDVFPEVAAVYGVPGMRGALGAMLRRKRNLSLVDADCVVAIGARMAERLAHEGVSREKIAIVHNWADGEAITPLAREPNALRERWNLAGKLVVGYSGNLGRVHEFDTMLDAAKQLLSRDDIRFVIVGRGPRLAETQERARREGLSNVMFQPHQERASLAQSLALPDVHLSMLQPRFEGLVLPSKLYGIMAAGRPTIFIGDPQGETASIISADGSGLTVASGDAKALCDSILLLASDAALRERMGVAARAAFDARYSMPIALGKWRELLTRVGY